jgi:acetyl-CoA carboxylase carboxyl transferase subunit alpha
LENTLAKKTFLDFEQPIAELENKIEELRYVQTESAVDISSEIDQLAKKSQQLTKDIYSELSPWQITKIARHAERPYTLDYIQDIFTHFVEMHGDRHFADDLSIVGGLARFNGTPCMVLGQQKGRDTKERGLRNFGMSKPEGYRKALRLMKTAEKFKLPVFTFVDTPGAYPGIDAEERCQSEAIGRNIFEMAQLEVPIITTIIGEGGSGGALAISIGDQVLMLQYSVYSVISPEGCASILWKTSEKAQEAADALGITAHRLKALGLIDKIVNEPVGGAHRDHKQMAAFLKRALGDAYRQVSDLKVRELLDRRYDRLQSYGRYTDTKAEPKIERRSEPRVNAR